MYGPCLSSILGDHALTPPIRLSLGEPLPHQQADRPQAIFSAGSYTLFPTKGGVYAELPPISQGYSPPRSMFLRVTQPSASIVLRYHSAPKLKKLTLNLKGAEQ